MFNVIGIDSILEDDGNEWVFRGRSVDYILYSPPMDQRAELLDDVLLVFLDGGVDWGEVEVHEEGLFLPEVLLGLGIVQLDEVHVLEVFVHPQIGVDFLLELVEELLLDFERGETESERKLGLQIPTLVQQQSGDLLFRVGKDLGLLDEGLSIEEGDVLGAGEVRSEVKLREFLHFQRDHVVVFAVDLFPELLEENPIRNFLLLRLLL